MVPLRGVARGRERGSAIARLHPNAI